MSDYSADKVCWKCDRVKMIGNSFYQASMPANLILEGAKLELCPECRARYPEIVKAYYGEEAVQP